jgi:RNA polymerase sigma-70 factor, ECF subfamily
MDDPIGTLLLQVAAQDRAAFRRIYSETSSKLIGVLLCILGNRSEAEEVLTKV